MPITLSQMSSRSASVTFQFEGQNVTVAYNPGKINDEVIAQLDGNTDSCTQALASVITSWDVMDDSVDPAVPYPTDVESLKKLDWPFRLVLRQEIVRDMRPN